VAQPADLQARPGRIKNRHWIIRAKAGAAGIIFSSAGTARRRAVALQLRAVTMDDPWGSWGGHDGEAEADHINRVKAGWKIDAVELLERGPERAALWVRLTQGASRLELTVHLYRDDPAIIVRARVFWTEKAARLKLMFSRGGVAEFEVPGGAVLREPCGEVPGGRWVRVGQGPHSWCFASDALYNFDVTAKTFGATVVRSCPYATSNRSRRTERPWRSYMDLGEHGFQFALGDGEADPAALAQRLESPPVALMVPAGAGRLPRRGGALGLSAGLKLLAFTRAESPDAWLLRVQNTLSRRVNGAAVFLGTKISLGSIPAGRIHTVLFQPAGRRWKAIAVNAAEEPVSAPSHL